MTIANRTVLIVALIASACGERGPAPVEQGRELAAQYGCVSCHAVDGAPSIGPTWKGLYGSEVILEDGTTVVADEKYLRESILQPSAKTVRGFEKGLMESVIKPNSLSEDEVQAIIAYIHSLH